ncbi:MAG: electron transfer oxidoreductase [Promethearchaeota archaeon CR_4]|nr:MAG: electron transfer oxidoreductase [Candidatus Lokiarchaeota archaeon CR_4]
MEFDVVVIGGGPAGTQCACDLADKNVSVVVLEQGSEADKSYVPCLMGSKLEAKFGIYPNNLIDGDCTCFRIIASRDYVDLPASVVDVPHLGRFFNKNAVIAYDRQQVMVKGAKFYFNTRVTSIQTLPDKVEARTTNPEVSVIFGKVAVLACGIQTQGSEIAQSLQIPRPKTTRIVWRSYQLPPNSPARAVNDMGLVWNDKMSSHAYVAYYNTPVGFFIALLDYNRAPAEMAGVLREVCTRHKIIAPLLEGAEHTTVLSEEDAQDMPREIITPTVKDRLLVLGDAAGLVNIFVYEGFYQAKVTGRCAADTILAAREQNRFDAQALASYKRRWEQELYEVYLKVGRTSAYMFYDTGKLDTVANALVKALKREQAEGHTKLQNIYLQNMISPAVPQGSEITWAKAILGEMSFTDKAVMLPRFLKAGLMK